MIKCANCKMEIDEDKLCIEGVCFMCAEKIISEYLDLREEEK